ncbi:MAG: Thiosulfate sulfurtransferase, rhodanese, partial [uncultured Rubrobacteraceae bacterium]
ERRSDRAEGLRPSRGPGQHRLGRGAPERPRERAHRGVRRGRAALRGGAHPERRQDRLGRGPERPARARLPGSREVRPPDGREGHRPRHQGRLLRGQEQLVGHLRLVGLPPLRPRQRRRHGRRKGQVGGRGPRDDPGGPAGPASAVPDAEPRRLADKGLQGRRREARAGKRPDDRRQEPRRVLGRAAPHAGLPAGGRPAGRSHPRRRQRAVGAGGEGGRHLQERRRAQGDLRGRGRPLRGPRGRRLLPHRGALQPHLVRAQVPARLRQRPQLRRLLDGVGQL